MTGNRLLDFAALSVSLFNAALMLWLGLTIALNAERVAAAGRRARPAWGAGLITLSLLLGGLFFISHSALLVLDLNVLSRGLNFWWQVGWWPVVALPVAWYVLVLWYSGYWDQADTALRRRHRRWLPLTAAATASLVLLVLFANPLPNLGPAPSAATPLRLGGLPVLILAYPVYIIGCVGLALDALLRPGPTGRVFGDEARRRARPWLAGGSGLLLLVSLLVTWVMLWFVTRLARGPGLPFVLDSESVTTIAWFDLAIASVIALAILLLGQALVAYEVFTGKTLPRRGLLRFWRNAVVLSAGYAVVAAASLTLQVRPVYIVLLSLALLAVSYALFSWRAYADRERHMVQLRPFVASQQLYEHLLEQAQGGDEGRRTNDDGGGPSPSITASFNALCREVLGARLAYLVPWGASAPLAGPPLVYAEDGAPTPIPGGLSGLSAVADHVEGREPIVFAIDPAAWGGAILALPLWAEQPRGEPTNPRRGLMGLLLLGHKSDGGLYAQEEIDIARAAGERLIDALASAELARRLLLLQRQRLAESHIADQRTRRVLHDDVLPQLHAALLHLHAEAPGTEASALLSAAHRQLSDLLREMPNTPAPDVARLGLVDALRRLLATELARAFDAVVWELSPEAEARALALPPLAADVLYNAAREALRNAARHARRPHATLRMTISLAPTGATGLELVLEDDGGGLTPYSANSGDTTGQGLSLHGTLLAVVGGTLTVESELGAGTRVRLTLS